MRRLRLSGTGCPFPVKTRGGVIRCVVSADACKQHRDVPRAVRYLADVAWWVRPWWPNEIGHAQDNAGRARMGLKPDRVDAAMVRLQGLTRR